MKIKSYIKLSAYILEHWLPRKKNEIKASTYTRYEGLCVRITEYLGEELLSELTPADVYYFYDELRECKRLDSRFIPTKECVHILKSRYTRPEIVNKAGVGMGTADSLRAGKKVKPKTAEKIAKTIGMPVESLFTQQSGRLSPQTIVHYHRLLYSIIKDAMFDELIQDNIMLRVRPPKLDEAAEARYLEADEAKELMRLLDGYGAYPYAAILKLIMFTGMRRGEACGLEWQDIDFEHGSLSIRRTSNYLPAKGVYTDTPKTRQGRRTIAFGTAVAKLLDLHRECQNKQRAEYGSGWIETGRLFTTDDGRPINPTSVTKYFHRFVERHGLPDCCVHSLRHTNASLLIAANTPITTIAGRLGHSDPSITLRIYSHQLSAENRKAGKAIEGIFE